MKTSNDCLNNNYLEYVKSISPKTKQKRSLFHAFWVGGVICSIGQSFRYLLEYGVGLTGDELSSYVSMIMIFLGALLTGLGVYDRIGKYAGGGSIVPITGFANSIASCAIEYKKEGLVFGVGAKMFYVAGPVLVNGVAYSMLVGIIYFIISLF